MKVTRTTLIALAALAMAGAPNGTASSQPHPALRPAVVSAAVSIQGPTVGIDFFYSNLAPYGAWVQRPTYGWVWAPRHVRYGWRPYLRGHWVWTDYGWTWISDDPWGWATCHYGRWYYDAAYGWDWVPGTDWGPAWVSWADGGNYVGWAPLPPQVGFSADVGLQLRGVDLGVAIAPAAYTFVPQRDFLAPAVSSFAVPVARNAEILPQATNVTNYAMANGRVVDQGIPVQRIAQVTGRPVPQLRLASISASDPRVVPPQTVRMRGNSVAMFRPSVVSRPGTPDPAAVMRSGRAAGSPAQLQRRQTGQALAARARPSPPAQFRNQHGPPSRARMQHGPPPYARVQHGPPSYARAQHGPPSQARVQHGPPSYVRTQHGPPSQARIQHGPPSQARVQHGPPVQSRIQQGPPSQARIQHGPPSQARVQHGPPQPQARAQQGPPPQARVQQGPPPRARAQQAPAPQAKGQRGSPPPAKPQHGPPPPGL